MSGRALLAHGFGIRYDLPVPLYLYLIAGGSVVALSFALVALLVRPREGEREYPRFVLSGRPVIGPLVDGPVPRLVMGAIGVGVLAGIIISGFLGSADATNNPAEYLLWIYFWSATVVLSGVVGNIYCLANPFSAIYDVIQKVLGRAAGGGILRYPKQLGIWPATAGYLLFAFFELASGQSANPRSVATLAVGYSIYTFGGMVAFGRDTWLTHGEFFSTLFRLIGAMGSVEVRSLDPAACQSCVSTCRPDQAACVNCGECARRSARTEIALRPLAVGLTRLDLEGWDIVTFVILTLSSLAFDGLSATPAWASMYVSVAPSFDPLGSLGPVAIKGLGLVALTLLFLGVYLLFVVLVNRFGGGETNLLRTAALFAYTLVPIALVYDAAHNYSYMVIQGQGIIPLLADPLHRGAHLIPTGGYRPSFALADAGFVWILQVILIVLGHIAAVYLAHVRALTLFPRTRAALRSQYPMLVLMIIYTITSLYILAQPITESS
ncbi:MAG: hypothetical protein ACYDGR_07670 [Candidatus Dormibacteria bacterium]